MDEIALAKRELIEGLAGPDTVAVLNADDPRVARFAEVARGRVLTFGFSPAAQFRAENIEDRGAEGSTFDFVSPQGRARAAHCRCPAATASPMRWRRSRRPASGESAPRKPPTVLPELAAGEMRGRLLRFADGFAVINDSYNSNPVALEAMTELLARTPGYRRRILAAGEMLELGPESSRLHRETGRYAAAQKIDGWSAFRALPRSWCRARSKADCRGDRARFFASSADAAAFLAELVQPGDLLLVKGSRGVKMERIVEALRARYALAD